MKSLSLQNQFILNYPLDKWRGRDKIEPVLNKRGNVQLNLSDLEDLLSLVAKERSKKAFKSLFDFYYPRLVSFGHKSGLSSEVSKELAQDSMLKVWKSANLYQKDIANPNTWIFTIARNLKYDLLRKQSRDPLELSSQDIYESEEVTEYDSETIFELAQTKHMISTLSDEQQSVLNGLYIEGLTQSEFAEKENIPLGTVKSRARLAIKNLKTILEEEK